jgi:hypothetical protein
MTTRRASSHANLRSAYRLDTRPAPFDPRESDERDTVIMVHTADALLLVDDPVIRADVIAEMTDHAPLQTMAVHEPQDKPMHPDPVARMARDAGCWVFELFAPDVANEKPMTAERRAAMHADRETLKHLVMYVAAVVSVGVLCWSLLQIGVKLWLLFGVARELS